MKTQFGTTYQRILTGTAMSGAALAVVLTAASPAAGTAQAHGYSTPSGDAVGRPGFGSEDTPGNPAPGVRAIQALGDRVFNQNTALNKALDDSPLGVNYHNAFGTPDYDHPTHGSNGTVTGLLNGGLIKTTYDGMQAKGVALPDEADLSATVIRQLSGHHVPASDHSSASATALRSCVAMTAKTALRAQGSC
ncbi:hypothetical protein ORI20_09790 [Mycobacterium sp. CVI_P3]|uniref:Uncharacterized protein n=1 Tax=Mycobacterium pinniadriaticum TaxID=2994102 RepID=A0ABT3SBU7_9MYCO|nr:hypothetical protein [Mycobacterium pinniadriaticum]MCX2930567.1 hypothetical protein [Mycobacterium pinniadriaticum]MCX2936991.1 hypothetical protein [Mycobacterium pinniadriaticum]